MPAIFLAFGSGAVVGGVGMAIADKTIEDIGGVVKWVAIGGAVYVGAKHFKVI